MEHCSLLRIRATKTGLVVDYRKFLEGKVVPASRILKGFMTTTLPDVMTDIQELCFQRQPETEIEIGVPNSFVTANLVVAYRSQEFRVICGRTLVRGLLNPFAAEFGKNYDILTYIESDLKEFHDELRSVLETKYECSSFDPSAHALSSEDESLDRTVQHLRINAQDTARTVRGPDGSM